jgi:thiol peroxidase
MVEKREGVVTFKGGPLTLVGPELMVGNQAPAFTIRTGLAPDSEYTLDTESGKVRILNVVPSIDTPTCDTQTRRFNEEAAGLGDCVSIVTVSMDLPPAQERWCAAAGVDRITMASDYYDQSFGAAYGLRIDELGLLARAVIIIDGTGTVRYAQVVPEVAEEPNYDAVLVAAKEVAA